jgi:hypothetical protein
MGTKVVLGNVDLQARDGRRAREHVKDVLEAAHLRLLGVWS